MICDKCNKKDNVLYIYPKQLLCLHCRDDNDKSKQSQGAINNQEICYWTKYVILQTINIEHIIVILEEY